MDQPSTILEPETRIITHAVLGSTTGMIIAQENLDARRPGMRGKILGWVPGHGGDVYWVWHDGATRMAPYCWAEFELDADEDHG